MKSNRQRQTYLTQLRFLKCWGCFASCGLNIELIVIKAPRVFMDPFKAPFHLLCELQVAQVQTPSQADHFVHYKLQDDGTRVRSGVVVGKLLELSRVLAFAR